MKAQWFQACKGSYAPRCILVVAGRVVEGGEFGGRYNGRPWAEHRVFLEGFGYVVEELPEVES